VRAPAILAEARTTWLISQAHAVETSGREVVYDEEVAKWWPIIKAAGIKGE
jgi:hypothetical protein